jgi:Arc/MetJ family transcription regulator
VPTNLSIDDGLLKEAVTVGGYRTKRETVNEALREFICRRRRRDLKVLFGTVEYATAHDYKKARRRR